MSLKIRGELDRLEAIEVLDGSSKTLVIRFFKINLVKCLVDGSDVLSLNASEEWLNQSNVSGLLHDRNTS